MRVRNSSEHHPARIRVSGCAIAALNIFVLLAPGALGATPARRLAPAQAATSEQLQTLARSMTFDWAKTHPINATFLGLSDEDGQLDTPSEAANARDLATIREWQKQLAAISLAGASLKDRDDAKLLGAQLTSMERQYTVYKTFEKDPSGPSVAILSAIYTQFLHLPVAGTSGDHGRRRHGRVGENHFAPCGCARVHRSGQRAGHASGASLRRHGRGTVGGRAEFAEWTIDGRGEGAAFGGAIRGVRKNPRRDAGRDGADQEVH